MSRFGKQSVPGCECAYNFTCGPCLQASVDRNTADRLAHQYWYEPALKYRSRQEINLEIDARRAALQI